MAVVKEYVCLAHGAFTGTEAKCPRGCTTAVEREFRTAPAVRSAKTKATDDALARLAASFGFTDLSNRSGTVAGGRPAGPELDFTPRWEKVPQGGVFHQGGTIEARDGDEGGALKSAQEYGSGVAIGPRLGVAPETLATNTLPLPIGGRLPKPRPHVVHADNTSAADFAKAVDSAA